MTSPLQTKTGALRRDFLKTTTVAASAAAAASLFPSGVRAAGSDAIRVGLIGCGGRGTGASDNVLQPPPTLLSSPWPTPLRIGSPVAITT